MCIINIPNFFIILKYCTVFHHAGSCHHILHTPLVVLLFPAWLSGGCRGHREQEEITRTQWASLDPMGSWCHTRKWDSCIALCHCVIVYSVAHPCANILVLLGKRKVNEPFFCVYFLAGGFSSSSSHPLLTTHKLLESFFLSHKMHTHRHCFFHCPFLDHLTYDADFFIQIIKQM